MSPPITYFPAYVGLFASLLLGVTCNAYLDIEYGSFGAEVLLWAIAFGLSLGIAWRQRGEVGENGEFAQKVGVVIAVLATFVIFMPMWGMPRAGLYLLAGLQAATNCVTVNRRKFRLGLLASAVMVMFATAHYRADWTMLFYLVPYIFAVVFTLVAEQVSTRAATGLAHSGGGQALAIIAASTCILGLAFVLYSATPQVSRLSMFWKYGQPTDIARLKAGDHGSDGGKLLKGGSSGGDEASDLNGGDGRTGQGDQDIANGGIDGPSGPGYRESSRWPTLAEMRDAAKRPGMPRWQSRSIESVAEVLENIQLQAVPLMKPLQDLLDRVGDYCSGKKDELLKWLAWLIALALLIAAWFLARETRGLQWLRMNFDYLRFGILGWRAHGNAGALQLYHAAERLFALHHVERGSGQSAREYLVNVQRVHYNLHEDSAELIALFERARYGKLALPDTEVERMRALYRRMYRQV
ncbi:MAG TPA: DUF4129 domain-containing protein [Rhodocyclaceae bacterium]|nr:DUF4129 domain-containing protein [Rhodocyclaceae bacterium]